MSTQLPERLRLRYVKLGRIRFTSQRDVARIIERALRRAALPLARTSGFTPRPQLSFGLALPTGCSSLAEYLDVRLDAAAATGDVVVTDADVEPSTLGVLAAELSELLPDGMDVTAAGALKGPGVSLQEAVGSCDWEVEVLGVSPAVIAGRVEHLLAADEVPIARSRKGRPTTDDLRPGILALAAWPGDEARGSVRVHASLATRPRGVRPAELCAALGSDVRLLGACRTHQWMENDDRTARAEPLTETGLVGNGPPADTEVRGG